MKTRVFARVLAEELEKIRGGGGGLTCVVTEPISPGSSNDITNVAGDNDGPEPAQPVN